MENYSVFYFINGPIFVAIVFIDFSYLISLMSLGCFSRFSASCFFVRIFKLF